MTIRTERGTIRVQAHHKGFPASVVGSPVSELIGKLTMTGEMGSTPVLVIDRDALDANLRHVQGLCDASGISLSPHVKTTMSPEIIYRQIEAGAWAVTVATAAQLRTVRSLGAARIILANEMVEPSSIKWLGEQLDRDAAFTAYCYVDSTAGIATLERNLPARSRQRPLPVLVELGMPGGRAGLRDVREAVRLAEAVTNCAALRLAGIGGFEGIIDPHGEVGGISDVERFLLDLRAAADQIYAEYACTSCADDFLVAAGGSAFLELLPGVFSAEWRSGRHIRVVMRSGCYVTHDSVAYAGLRDIMACGYDAVKLAPAMTLWSRVLSRPEPGLAILDFGRRDVGTDAGLPIVEQVLRHETPVAERAPEASVIALNDQHAYVRAAAADFDLQVGDLLGLGISHPCTVFDKWRLIPIVDGNHTLLDVAQTLF